MRTCLSPGTVIPVTGEGTTRQVYIERVIGEGASCIVYDGFFVDVPGVKERCRLKECYPLDAKIRRQDNRLVWDDPAEKLTAQKHFQSIMQKSIELHNEPDVGNRIVKSNYYEDHDNFYLIMDIHHGQTLDKDNTQDINRILKIVLKLTQLVGKLHNLGCRYLDLKPDNILVSNDPDPEIWLFDFDSLVPMDNSNTISYSKGWAAPELVQGKFSSLCNATDLYSVGAILFNKTMGRFVTNDDIGLFAKWNFEGKLFEEVNPKIKRLLCAVFRKSLAANTKRRYQSADELATILEQACKITAAGVPYLISDYPALSSQFFGREQEILAIQQAFKEKTKAVFLHGEGGIGKSTLATAYAHSHENDYDAILFCRYKTSLEDLLTDLADGIQNCDGDTAEKLRLLKRLLDKDVLLIVDNFDVEVDQDEYLDEFLRYKAQIIFTTRTNFASVYSGEVRQIEVTSLPYDKLVQVFCSAGNLNGSSVQENQVHTLLKFVDFNTYGTELLGLQVASSGCSLNELISKLSKGLDGLASSEKVRTRKDGKIVKKTLPDVIRILFQIANLNEDQKRTLRNLYLLRFLNINHETYRWYSYEFNQGIDILNDLVETGWVRYDANRRFFTLHPLVEELVKSDLAPNEDNCIGAYHVINQLIEKTIDYSGYDDAEEYEFENNCHFLCAFFASLDFSVAEHRQKAIRWFHGLIENELYIGSPNDYYFKKLHQKLLAEVEAHHTTPQETFDIRYILVNVWCYEFSYFRIGETAEERKKREEIRLLEYRSAFDHAKNAAYGLLDLQREDALDLLYAAIPWGRSAMGSDIPKDYLLQLYNERPGAFSFDIEDKDWLGIPVSVEERKNAERGREKVILPSNSSEETISDYSWTQHIDAIMDSINSAESPLAAAQAILNDGKTPIYEAVALLINYCDGVIHKIICNYLPENVQEYLDAINWNDVQSIMDMVDSACASSDWLDEYNGYDLDENDFFTRVDNGEPYVSSIHSLQIHRAIVAAILANHARFCELVEGNLGSVDNRQNPTSRIFDIYWDDIAFACRNIGKNSYAVPYLVKYMEELGVDPGNYPGERDYIKNYVMIKEMAELACGEVGPNDSQYTYFCNIIERMTVIIDRITGKRYSFKEEIESLGGKLPDDATKSDIDSSLERLYKQRFYESQDKVAFVQAILTNPSLSDFEKATRIAHCTDVVFMPFHMNIHHPNRSYILDWAQMEKVLDIEEEHLISDAWEVAGYEEHEECRYFLECNTANQAIVYAATGNVDMFEHCMDIILNDIERDITLYLKNNAHWSHYLDLKRMPYMSISSVINGLLHIKKQSWIVHYLIRIEQGWKEYAISKGYKDKDVFFSLYKSIAECAEAADLEKDVPTKYQQDFFEIYMSYQEKMDEIAGATYTLRPNDE